MHEVCASHFIFLKCDIIYIATLHNNKIKQVACNNIAPQGKNKISKTFNEISHSTSDIQQKTKHNCVCVCVCVCVCMCVCGCFIMAVSGVNAQLLECTIKFTNSEGCNIFFSLFLFLHSGRLNVITTII